MTAQKQLDKNAKDSTNPKDDAAEPSKIKRELTDQEIASVAAGQIVTTNVGPNPLSPV
jgi:hypothetical protein